jgi:hypothetical protein
MHLHDKHYLREGTGKLHKLVRFFVRETKISTPGISEKMFKCLIIMQNICEFLKYNNVSMTKQLNILRMFVIWQQVSTSSTRTSMDTETKYHQYYFNGNPSYKGEGFVKFILTTLKVVVPIHNASCNT